MKPSCADEVRYLSLCQSKTLSKEQTLASSSERTKVCEAGTGTGKVYLLDRADQRIVGPDLKRTDRGLTLECGTIL